MQFYCEDYHGVLAVLEEGTNRSDLYAVRRACAEFTRLVLHRNAVRHEMAEEGRLLPVLVGIVAEHVQEEQGEVLADCCRFFQRLISLKQPTELDIQAKITQAGCLGLLFKGLTIHPRARQLYTETCKLIALLCFDTPTAPHAENQTDIADSGLYEAVCARLASTDITEEEAVAGCAAVAAIIYENAANADAAIRVLHLLAKFSTLLSSFPESPRIAQHVCQTLFQLTTMEPCLSDDVVDAGMLQQVVEFMGSGAFLREDHGISSFTVHWHVVKFLEITIRHNDTAKDAFSRCGGPAAVVNTITRRSHRPRNTDDTAPSALHYISCMLLSRLAMSASDPPVLAKDRAMQLAQANAHQLALDILRSVGSKTNGKDRNVWAAVEQAVRLLELIAALEANRIPLTRMGASRQVKLVYNNPEVATQPGLLLLCERAVANIEGI